MSEVSRGSAGSNRVEKQWREEDWRTLTGFDGGSVGRAGESRDEQGARDLHLVVAELLVWRVCEGKGEGGKEGKRERERVA